MTIIVLTLIIIIAIVLVVLDIQKSLKYYERTPDMYNKNPDKKTELLMVSECDKYANETEIRTARVDRYLAGEESFYQCLVREEIDPYKYTWRGKEPSKETLTLIKFLLDSKMAKKDPNLHQMSVTFAEADYLKERYHATSVFVPSKEESDKALKLLEDAINANAARYAQIDSNRQIQYIGMEVEGKRMMYAFAWLSSKSKVRDKLNPEKVFISPIVKDGGDYFIDAVIDLSKWDVTMAPHSES